ESRDVDVIYEIPLRLKEQNMDQIVLDHFGMEAPEADMTEWTDLVDKVKSLKNTVRIGLVGKYVELQDAYISVVEALKHAGFAFDSEIEVDWINAEQINAEN